MRSRRRDKQLVWFCTFTEVTPTGSINKRITYSKPYSKQLAVSSTSGDTENNGNGFTQQFDRYVTCYRKADIPESGTMCFVDIEPMLSSSGDLSLNTEGVPITKPDYVVEEIIQTKRGTTFKFGLKKVR